MAGEERDNRSGEYEHSEVPLWDQFSRFCDQLDKSLPYRDPSQIPLETLEMRLMLGINDWPMRVGNVYTMSDSQSYDFYSQSEAVSQTTLQEIVERDQIDADVDEFQRYLSGRASFFQRQVDVAESMDVLVNISHINEDGFVDLCRAVKEKYTALGGQEIDESEWTPNQVDLLEAKTERENYRTMYVVRFPRQRVK